MMHPIRTIRNFVRDFGPVEQAQVVASTAVVISMVTIVSAMAAIRHSPGLMDFISVLTVGLFGFATVYFSLRYARQIDAQRRHLLALNTIADRVNHIVDLFPALDSALDCVVDVLHAPYGWIYILEADRPVLKSIKGSTQDFFSLQGITGGSEIAWLRNPRMLREHLGDPYGAISPALKAMRVQCVMSIPLHAQDSIVAAMIIAGWDIPQDLDSHFELMQAFGNQISVALTNASLFEKLKQSERQYEDLFENAPDIYLNVGANRVILDCNATGATMLGTARADLIGRPCEECFVEERRSAVRDLLDRMLIQGEALLNVEEVMADAAGRRFSVHLNSTLVVDEKGRTINARIVARDITERKKIEQALVHAQKIDSIGNLAGGIAHDFNNILTAVLGSAAIIRKRMPADLPLVKYVDIIESAGRRGSSVTRQLLTFARRTERQANTIDMNVLVKDTLQLFERGVAKNIQAETAFSKEPVAVSGDEGQIQQAILNLLLNARDAMPKGGTVNIGISAVFADSTATNRFSSVRPGPFVAIRVSDSGVGIPYNLQGRIFEPFFSTKEQGTGLGLSVVYGVVQSHGGYINVESEPGCGTSVTLYLPRVAAANNPAAKSRRLPPRGTETILVVDDELGVSEVASDMLTELGYTVYVQHDGRAGVDFYRTRQASIDLILLDVNMPVLGGKEAFGELRAINPDCCIIIVTGYGRETMEMDSFPGRVNGLVQKPFQQETLAFTVRRALDTPVTAVVREDGKDDTRSMQ